MEVRICKNPAELGKSAAIHTANVINECIAKKGSARIALSTGASQFDTIKELVKQDVDWSKVEMFHLDEYVDLPETHVASFRKYLKERFVDQVKNLKAAHFVDGTEEGIARLTAEIRKAPIDIGLIGIGENAHIAFNDPPANFETTEAYHIVNLNDRCKQQQMGEGWFATIDDVPKQAVSMTVHQILACERIVSCVPYAVKADAVKATLETKEVTNMIPATIMKDHKDFILYIDSDSAKYVFPFEIK
ncbi:MAG: glucosamine-6-phosphate deaminase [Ruminococcaceae bacterium]|nr:glucosamine-6-phosphate deaminase [Oscillospiraceae bacterium]MBQ7118618.1 6-phosphogluconolactonase [Oscillospiraceae bacterium]